MNRDRIFAVLATVAVVTGLALGFRELGSPHIQRLESADLARTRDLEQISQAINMAHVASQRLPATLDELKKTNAGLRINDPETKAPYGYSVQGQTQYQLCATYATDNRIHPSTPGELAHPSGTYCTSYVVNKRLY